MKEMRYPVIDLKATGANIKQLMKDKEIKPTQLSTYMGFNDVRSIYKWMSGNSLPSLDNMFALSRILETPVEDILIEDIEMSSRFIWNILIF